MKKILITGITGFAGSFLAEYLISQDDNCVIGTCLSSSHIKSIDHIKKDIEIHEVDLNDKERVLQVISVEKPDEVYHLAASTSPAESFKNPAATITNNITCQINLLEAIKSQKLSSKILITSSAEVYGAVDEKEVLVTEETPLRPVSPYAVSKIAQDFLAYEYFLAERMNIIRVRPFNHIGPRQAPYFVTAAFAKQIAEIEKEKSEPVLNVGNIDTKRDFTDVRDMIRAYVGLLEKGKMGDVYNIGSGGSHKISEILDILISFSSVKINIQKDEELVRPHDIPDIICDCSKMKKVTGWEPKIPLEKTLKDILEYWRGIV